MFIKNNKGFSLLEVLVAVSIIGIISAIAIPAFQDYRATASKTAGDTSVGNIGRAFQNCMVLKQFGQCDDLNKIGIECTDCKSGKATSPDKFCAQIEKKIGGETFRACVDFAGNDMVGRAYGGDLFENIQICQDEVTGSSNTAENKSHAQKGAKECTAASDCPDASTSWPCTGASCAFAKKCAAVPNYATAGACGATTGECTR